MIMRNIALVLTFSTFCFSANAGANCKELDDYMETTNRNEDKVNSLKEACEKEKKASPSKPSTENKTNSATASTPLLGSKGIPSGEVVKKCPLIVEAYETAEASGPVAKIPKGYSQCLQFKALSITQGFNDIVAVDSKGNSKTSIDGTIKCVRRYSYTMDYEPCVKVLNYYNAVTNAEIAMELQQKVRTDLKNKSILEKQNVKAQKGDLQGGSLDAAIESNDHMKAMNKEKLVAYGVAVTALGSVLWTIPNEKNVIKVCEGAQGKTNANEYANKTCHDTVKSYAGTILANQDAKAGLASAIMNFTAKAIAAGILMNQNDKASNQIAASKKLYDEVGKEILSDRCTSNPNDPACVKKGSRVSQSGYKSGDFTVGDGVSNSFDMTPTDDVAPELGAETNLGDSDSVAGINSPFVDAAREANGIINPAAAAQMQATGGAKAGGPGGGGAGGGGGGASLGTDLKGEDKDANKENQIKSTSLAGNYEQGGGGGFRAPGKEKDDANPFASLFDAKSEGDADEETSIDPGDIDSSSSGLFQKISKRYGLIQADKRIEANNLE